VKKNIFVVLSLCLLTPIRSFATPDPSITEEVHSGPEKKFNEISNSVVKIKTQYGYGTGTVFSKDKKLYVLTANHVISSRAGEKVFIKVVRGEEEADATAVLEDPDGDVAILSIPDLSGITPYKIKFLKNDLEVGDKAGYCGFPNRPDLSCFSGNISSISPGYIHLHAYAFGGASGSLVIDSKGRAIGILSAIEVGNFYGIPTPLEDVVWIVPLKDDIFESL